MTPRRDTRSYLSDIVAACEAVAEYTKGMNLAHYAQTRQLRSSVERELFIIGEAVIGIKKQDPLGVHTLGDVEGIIEVRNILAHSYFIVKHDRIWNIALEHVPRLLANAKEWSDTLPK